VYDGHALNERNVYFNNRFVLIAYAVPPVPRVPLVSGMEHRNSFSGRLLWADVDIRADGAQFHRFPGARADIEKGTCSSVSLCLRSAPPQTARPATSIATLRCETVSEQVRHRLTDALRSIGPRPDAPALIRESGQETVAGQASHRLLLVSHPRPSRGE
jgi:hypothetical protein